MTQHEKQRPEDSTGNVGVVEVRATIDVRPTRRIGRIDPNIYGHFLESAFFGNIEGGVFEEGSALSYGGSDVRSGLRQDVIELCRELGLPVVRWPGGNFTSPYHWEDGIGPRDARPRRLELAWGSEETNRFGTDEFLAWCAEVGTEPYLAHSCRNVDDAVRWVEYTNYGGDTDYTRRRASNGHPDPYRVQFWGLGNEVYGPWQMGHRSAERYAADAREHARFMRTVDPLLRFIAVGANREDWTRAVLAGVGRMSEFISLHLYGASNHLHGADQRSEYEAVVAQSVFVEQQVHSYARMVAELSTELGLEQPPAISMDEWNMRHLEPASWSEPQPSADGSFVPRPEQQQGSDGDGGGPNRLRVNRYSPRTLADALFYAGVFHALHRASGLPAAPRMANTVNLLNANGVIVARPSGALRAATFHVWDLYQNHTGSTAVEAEVRGPSRTTMVRQGDDRNRQGGFATLPATVADLDVSATLTEDGRSLRLAVINRSADRAVRSRIMIDGGSRSVPREVEVRSLGADTDELFGGNTMADPDRVATRVHGRRVLDDGVYAFEPHSITLLSLDLS